MKMKNCCKLLTLLSLTIMLAGCDRGADEAATRSEADSPTRTTAPVATAPKVATLLGNIDGQPWAYDDVAVTMEKESYKGGRDVIRLTFIQHQTEKRNKNWVLITIYADTGELRHISYDKAMNKDDGKIANLGVEYDADRAERFNLATDLSFTLSNGTVSGSGSAETVAHSDTSIRSTVSDLQFANLRYQSLSAN